MQNQHRTVNIHTDRKLSGKSRDEILEAVLSCFNDYNVHFMQQFFDLIRVTFHVEVDGVLNELFALSDEDNDGDDTDGAHADITEFSSVSQPPS